MENVGDREEAGAVRKKKKIKSEEIVICSVVREHLSFILFFSLDSVFLLYFSKSRWFQLIKSIFF